MHLNEGDPVMFVVRNMYPGCFVHTFDQPIVATLEDSIWRAEQPLELPPRNANTKVAERVRRDLDRARVVGHRGRSSIIWRTASSYLPGNSLYT